MTTVNDRKIFKLSDLKVRSYESRDAQAVLELFSQPACREGMATDAFTTTDDVKSWIDCQGKDAIALVACENDSPVGLGLLVPGQDSRRFVGGVVLFIHDEFHRRGIGSMLLNALVSTADVFRGFRRLELWVLCGNEAAMNLYKKFGFVIEGRHNCFAFRNGRMVDVFTMGRVLPEAIWSARARLT